jgi:hypothetical protein
MNIHTSGMDPATGNASRTAVRKYRRPAAALLDTCVPLKQTNVSPGTWRFIIACWYNVSRTVAPAGDIALG